MCEEIKNCENCSYSYNYTFSTSRKNRIFTNNNGLKCKKNVQVRVYNDTVCDLHERKKPFNFRKVKIDDEFTNEEVSKYFKYMIFDANYRNTYISLGYKRIAKEIGISQTKAMKIKSHLEMKNIIKCEGQQTKIIKWEE